MVRDEPELEAVTRSQFSIPSNVNICKPLAYRNIAVCIQCLTRNRVDNEARQEFAGRREI
jgi:hypothetical protein